MNENVWMWKHQTELQQEWLQEKAGILDQKSKAQHISLKNITPENRAKRCAILKCTSVTFKHIFDVTIRKCIFDTSTHTKNPKKLYLLT